MGKAPALAPCLFCGEMPCVCTKRAREAAQGTPSSRKAHKSAPLAPGLETAPDSSRRRFDATAVMRAASVTTPPGVHIPASIPRPVAPVPPPVSAPVVSGPTATPAPAQPQSVQAIRDSDVMDYALHLLRVELGAVPVTDRTGSGALEIRTKAIRERLHRE